MPKKLSIRRKVSEFCTSCDDIVTFTERLCPHAGDRYTSWIHEYAIVRLYRSFEDLMVSVLVGCLNQDSQTLSDRTGIKFPKHLNVAVCRYLVTGGGYFDFRGRDGLIKELSQFLGRKHNIVLVVKHTKYKTTLEALCTLRNFAAHGSQQAKKAAKDATRTNMSSAGAWLKRQNRLREIVTGLKALAEEIAQRVRV